MSASSHYDELKISHDATTEEIRTAYRRAALIHHPDKNQDDPNADTRFQRIQQAYTVLSDEHERAWYDSQRQRSTLSSSRIDIDSLTKESAYSGFGEGSTSFWNVYSECFNALAKVEEDAMDSRARRKKKHGDIGPPPFGGKDSGWTVVKQFYGWWDTFGSARTFEEEDKWNLGDARSRWERRAMEKENNRERVRRKKEYNAEVRSLVEFVKKRDPRVIKKREQEEREKQARIERKNLEKAEKKMKKEKRRRERALESEDSFEDDADALDEVLRALEIDEAIEKGEVVPDQEDSEDEEVDENGVESDAENPDVNGFERKMYNGEEEREEEENEEEAIAHVDEEDNDEQEELYCAVCKKSFKSSAQRENHEKSKKHKAAAQKLRKKLLAEDEAAGIGINSSRNNRETELETEVNEQYGRSSRKKKKKKNRQRVKLQALSEQSQAEDDDGLEINQNGTSNTATVDENLDGNAASEDITSQIEEESVPEQAVKLTKKEKRRRRNKDKKAEPVLRCNVCGEVFASRTKLFTHIKELGHALHVPNN